MRKIASYSIGLLIVLMIFINYKACVVNHTTLMVTQNTLYAVVQDDINFTINVPVFINGKNNITNPKTISYMYLSDKISQKKIQASEFEINHVANKKILGQKYQKYDYTLTFTSLKNDFHINEAFLTVVFKNDDIKQFKIGKISALYKFNNEDESHINVTTLFGTKKDNSYGCLDTVTIHIKPKVAIKILKIKLNHEDVFEVNEDISGEKAFNIKINQAEVIYQKSSIVIEYQYGLKTHTMTVENFLFFDIINSESESGGINYIYELN